jgi:hypothetical protein
VISPSPEVNYLTKRSGLFLNARHSSRSARNQNCCPPTINGSHLICMRLGARERARNARSLWKHSPPQVGIWGVCDGRINAAAALAHRIDSRSIRVRSKGLTLSAPAVHVRSSRTTGKQTLKI